MKDATEIRQARAIAGGRCENRAGFDAILDDGHGTALAGAWSETHMLDREKIVVVLKRRFPGSAAEQIAAAANAIVGLDDEWVEVDNPDGDWETYCRDGCHLRQVSRGDAIRVFRRTFSD